MRPLKILSIAFLLAFPFSAHAAGIFQDNLDSGTTGWNSNVRGGTTAFTAQSGVNCHGGSCFGVDPGGNVFYAFGKLGTPLAEGELSFWYKTNEANLIADVLSCSGSLSGCFDTQHKIGVSNSFINDGTYHQKVFAWRETTGMAPPSKELCELNDDTDLNHCTWGAVGTAVSGDLMDAVFIGSNGTTLNGDYAYFDDFSGITGITVNNNTRIDITTPYRDEVISTSTAATFGATGFVNADDFEDGMFVEIKYAPYTAMQSFSGASPDLLFTRLELPITAAGAFSVSTTSPAITKGQYTMQQSIRTPSFVNNALNFIGFGQFANFGILTSTSTEFVAGAFNGYDTYVASTTEALEDYLASSTISLASCSIWTSFNLGDCLNLLFVPQKAPISKALGNFKSQFLSYFPWGYVTRFIVIITGNATSSLPTFVTTIPISPSDNLQVLSFDPNEMIRGGGTALNSITDRYSGLNIKEIFQPMIRLFIGLFIAMIVIHDVLGLTHVAAHGGRGGKIS